MSKRIVVIGAVALGTKAACRAKRLNPQAEVTLIDQSDRISYGGCGIPYYVSGEVPKVDDLRATPYGSVRDASFFRSMKDVKVMTQTRATKIDRAAKTITIENVVTQEMSTLPYDKLVLALGSSPNRPPIPGIELAGISPATNLDEAECITKSVEAGEVNSAVVVGGGFIGLEMAVALAEMRGISTAVVEIAPQILPNFLSNEMARMAQSSMENYDIEVYTNEKVVRFEGENGRVTKVVTDKRELDADLVVMAAGVRPNTEIAKDAGLELDARGLIVVNEYMQTSDPDIYSGGDCASVKNLITGKPSWFPLGSMANRQGRIVGTNAAGENTDKFPGAVGAWGVKLTGICAGGAGLTPEVAKREGYDAVSIMVEQVDRAHFYPVHNVMTLQLVVEKGTRRVLGIQGLCAAEDSLAARINPVSVLLTHGTVTVEDISNLEVLYSPPFSSAMDVVNALGNTADNCLSGKFHFITPERFEELWNDRKSGKYYFVDTRVAVNSAAFAKKHAGYGIGIPQEEFLTRIGEVPTDKPAIFFCSSGLRSFECHLHAVAAGKTNTMTVFGGASAADKLGVDLFED